MRGFAAATALFAIALFALLGAVAVNTSRSSAKAQVFQETKDKMAAQSALILNTLLLCGVVYPNGDGTGTGPRSKYPATPADGLVSSLVCPGQSPSLLWSGDAFAIAPLALPGFSAWTYINDATSIRITTTANNTNVQYYQDLLDAVVKKVGANQGVRSGDTLTITLFN
jgi:hypothetical protein